MYSMAFETILVYYRFITLTRMTFSQLLIILAKYLYLTIQNQALQHFLNLCIL